MDRISQISPMDTVDFSKKKLEFAFYVKKRSGVDINMCWQCKTCTNGCPFSEAMDYAPNAIIRLVQLGLKMEALKNSTIWLCVGCNTCSLQCPNAIDMAALNDTLREISIEEGIVVAEPDILQFHREVLHSVERYGRTHKLEIMLRYKAYKRDWFADLSVGLKMMTKRKLDLLPTKNDNILEIKKLFGQKQVA
ncbi:4Fe-4S dicluster domain-containing protein [Thermodesulfobacteriota bacterium]